MTDAPLAQAALDALESQYSDDARRIVDLATRNRLIHCVRRCFGTLHPGGQFKPNWHHEAIGYHLERVARGEIRRLIITMPPRSLKSISASVAFPAWLLGRDPTSRVLCVSYAQSLAGLHARDTRTVMTSDWYRRAFPQTCLDPRKMSEEELATTRRGVRLAISVGGALTGRGAPLIVIDDPLNAIDVRSEVRRCAVHEWFGNSLLSRLDDKVNGAIVIVAQRLHVEDLIGYVTELEDFDILDLPAIAEAEQHIPIGPGRFHTRHPGELLHPDREPLEELEALRRATGSDVFAAQWQQSPVPPGGAMIQRRWLASYQAPPRRQPSGRLVQSWDTAIKSGDGRSYSVCVTALVQGERVYILDVFRERLGYPDLKRAVLAQSERWRPDDILIEDKASGSSLIQELKAEKRHPIAIVPEGDKQTRMAVESPKIEAGAMFLPREAVWLDAFVKELLQFPNGSFDDQVDALSQLLRWLRERKPQQAIGMFPLKGWGR